MVKIEDVTVGFEMGKKEEHYTMLFKNELTKQYVLSKYTPRQDAIKKLEEDKGNKQTTWIIVGFALGYIVKELLEQAGEDVNIIVIEPSEELLNKQMEYEQNIELKDNKNVHFLCGEINQEFKQKLSQYIPNSEINNIKIICMDVYVKFYLDYCSQIKQVIEDVIYLRVIDMNTIQKYNKLFTENIIKNRYAIESSYRFEALKDKCKGIPALVVSAGPSLEKNIKYIKDFKGLILVGNRTIAAVVEQGRKPHFMFAADPENIILDTTRGMMSEDIPLVVNDNANNSLIEAHPGKKYFIKTTSNSEELLGVKGIGDLSMGGSVATLCASAAQYMGCNPIIYIGQDCAYTDMKIYSGDCANTLFTDDMRNDSDYLNISKIWVDEYYGGKVLSSMDLVSFIRWFEKFAEDNPKTTFINATEGGALIKGTINKPFKEVVEEYQDVTLPDFSQYDQKVEAEIPVDEKLKEIVHILKDIIKKANSAKALSKQLKAEYIIYKGTRQGKVAELIRKLDKIDEKIKKHTETTVVVRMIFSNLNNETQTALTNKGKIGESEVEEGIRIATDSYNLYINIAEACQTFIDIIERNK